MRLAEISLLRWGAFTDRTLRFRPDARLHILYGPNEAGKTTVLRAVHDLLFGIHRQSTYATRHGPNVRLGGGLVASDGSSLAFRRRRGNSATLLDLSDKPLPDGALTPYLGSVDADMFTDLFGLDHQAMRDGAEAMLQAEGELGSSLFAAAGGVRNLVRVRGALAAEAGELFTPRRAANKRFYKALDAYDDAVKRVRDASLAVGEWQGLEQELAEAGAREQRLAEEFHAANRRHAHLVLLRRAAPILRSLGHLEGRLSELSDAPLLPADFRERVEAVRLDLDKARQLKEVAAAERARCLAERQAMPPDQAILDRSAAVEEANKGTGRHAKDQSDVDKLERDLRRYDNEVAGLLADLVSPGQPLPAPESGPSEPDERALRALAGDRRALTAARHEVQQRVVRTDIACQRLHQQKNALTAVERPTAERAMLDQLRQHGPVEQAAAAAGRATETARTAVMEALGRLGLAGWPIEAAAALALPDSRTVEAFGRRFEQADQRLRDLGRECETVQEEFARHHADLAELEAASPLPTPGAIAAARQHRDAGWRLVRIALIDGQPRPDMVAAYGEPLPEAYERAVQDADTLADRRDAEADRLARHAQLGRSLARAQAKLAAVEEKAAAARTGREQLDGEWQGIWAKTAQPSPSLPQAGEGKTPSAMLDWLHRHGEFLRLVQDLRTAEANAAQANDLRTEVRRQLGDLLVRLDETAPEGAAVADLLALADGALVRREKAFEAWRTISADLTQAEEMASAEKAEDARLTKALQAWQQDWQQTLSRAGLPVDAAPQAVEAMLDGWSGIRGKRRERQREAARLDGLRRDIAEYQRSVASLAAQIGADPAAPVADLVTQLYTRLGVARTARDKAADLDRRAEAQRLAEEQAAARSVERQAELDALLRLAGAASLDFLPDRMRRAAERAEAERQITAARQALDDSAPGFDAAELTAAVAAEGKDDDGLDLEILELHERLPKLAEQRSQAAVAKSSAEARMQALRSGAGAADAAQEARNALAELRAVTEEWMRLRAAELLLARAIDSFRANAQDPMVRRAGDIFRRVTLGAYRGLAVDYDAGDSPVLVGVDAGGERCPVGLMSDGTRDQLYLALRIASIERYAERAEPIPFLADDLFINWDDHRTEEGVAVLAELGAKTQTLLLTHHLAIVEAARRRLPAEDVEIIRLDVDPLTALTPMEVSA